MGDVIKLINFTLHLISLFDLVVLLDELGGLLPLQLGEGDLLEGRLLALLALRRQREIG